MNKIINGGLKVGLVITALGMLMMAVSWLAK